jgi:multicomponent Na+:H+ antiporter subunit E
MAAGEDSTASGARVMLLLAIGGFLLWLLLTGSLATDELAAGALVAVAAAALARSRIVGGVRLTPAAPAHIAAYLGVSFVALVRSNLDAARRLLSPSLPMNPGFVQVRTGLRSELGRLLLANSITLTPGTLTVDVEEDRLLVHWIDCPAGTDVEEATRLIAAEFEKYLKGFVR